ncbi:MAG TPA: zinc-binding dehydrogenase [Anaeromyxobacter sp.]
MRTRRAVITRFGGPETIEVREAELADPGPGEVQLRVLAAGVAFGDVLKRRGMIPGLRPPFTPGYDLAGEVLRGGPGASRFRPGDRVCAFVMNGGNAEATNLPERLLVPIPAGLDAQVAAALVLDGVTAWQLLHREARVAPGERILVHGGGGGVGTLLLQLARAGGAVAFATASAAKRAVVERFGGISIDYRLEDFVAALRRLAPEGVDAVFDPIGGAHLARSRAVLRRGGRLVCYGASSAVGKGRAAFLPTLARIVAYRLFPRGRSAAFYGIGGRLGREDPTVREDLARVLELAARGALEPVVGARIPLGEARRAHELKERGGPAGKVLLVPGG